MNPKILLLDIETAPSLVYVWGLYDQNVSLDQIVQDGYMLSWSAKWFGQKEIMFDSIFRYKKTFDKTPTNDVNIATSVWKLVNEADIIIAHNGDNFDLKWINTIFLKHGMSPVAPYKSIDTLKVARDNFKFLSNKLDFISKSLGLGQKVKHEGFGLWIKCMKGDKDAWAKMEQYNKVDVQILEQVYLKIRPFIKNHPNLALYIDSDKPVCPNCAGKNFIKNGYAYTNLNKFQRYLCTGCGKNCRGRVSLLNQASVLTNCI